MKNKLVIPIVAGLLVLVGLGVFAATNTSDKTSKKSSEASKSGDHDEEYVSVKACDLFTLSEAKAILGEAATAGDQTLPAGSDDVNLDTCSYTNNATDVKSIRVASVMVRSAKSKDGITSNKEAFNTNGAANQSGAQAVTGYGDKAFWDPSTGQLAVLEEHGHNWIGIVYGSAGGTSNVLDDAKLVADKVIN